MSEKERGDDWTPVTLPPEPLELVDVKLPDGSVCTAAWTGRIWWVKDGQVNPTAWRKRPLTAFGSLILK
jgi:hypothetical protein